MHKFPKFIGHRGAPGFAPENTIISMRIAKECGAQMVEFDVKMTKDNELIVMHDSTVDRTTNGHGKVFEMTLEEIKTLDAGLWFDPSFADTKVPTLKEMFCVLKELNLTANIEIKPCPGTEILLTQKIVPFIQKHWPSALQSPLISSFSTDSLMEARRLDSTMHLGLILNHPVPHDWKFWAKKLEVSAISVSHWSIDSSSLISEMHNEGYRVLAYTVNDQQRAEELYNFGIDSIFTNYPGSIISR